MTNVSYVRREERMSEMMSKRDRLKSGEMVRFRSPQRFYEYGGDDGYSTLGGIEIVKPCDTTATVIRWAHGRNADHEKLLVKSEDGMFSWCWWDQIAAVEKGADGDGK